MRHRTENGFTLLEVIVALAIAVASVASLYKIYAVGWRGVRLAEIDSAAIEVAKSQLASAGVEAPLQEGTASGVAPGGIAWTSEVRSYVPPNGLDAPPSAQAKAPQAYWVRVRVTWNEGPARPERSLELETIKLKLNP
jgi:general secretion pathway protein I